ncbi:MAG TPA: CocE/NonD family hydrolase [Baekduia sp.]|uniref:S15 peptidase family protein n=1 Tax=Baekduia sp. TaxID=2600305 RepID=UPI002C0F1D3A|nr:CocE/NonD family hydrolase [Baekduia sp.]HMJ36870.1 CocE/NonD family hydrolase [Baekduia sp.]
MVPVPRPALLGAAVAALLALAPAAAHAAPTPFGHECTPANGVRFCPTNDLASRPTSFDGTPIDVDVTLPATGDGPFPTILLLHGLGGDKTSFESTTSKENYTNWFFAQQGYAVVTPTARGFGNSCGKPDSRTAGCEAGWTRLGDMRYEVRDVQTLVGQLVDQGVVKPDAIGSTGISYGGGFSTMLAFLKDRVRLPDGGYAPWTSPKGTPISLAAAWPRWLWSNGESIFTRNGRGPWSRTPTGVEAQNYAGGIFAVALSAFVAPPGGDLSTDITSWKQQLDTGTFGASAQATLDNSYNYHGVAGVAGSPSPLLLQSGWTDALFPVGQSLGAYDHVRAQSRTAPVSLQVGDLGHAPGANHAKDTAAFDASGLAFFDAWLKGTGAKPTPGSATAYTMTCPATAPSGGGPYTATSFDGLSRSTLRFGSAKALKITSKGAGATLAAAVAPLSATASHCLAHPVDKTSKATVTTVSPGATLIGQTVITGTVATKGRYGQLDARIWDLNPKTGKQQLIDRGTYRLTDNQKGSFRFTLDGNGWKFPKGHRIVAELLGRDAPTYGPSPAAFSATLTKVKVSLPVREKR